MHAPTRVASAAYLRPWKWIRDAHCSMRNSRRCDSAGPEGEAACFHILRFQRASHEPYCGRHHRALGTGRAGGPFCNICLGFCALGHEVIYLEDCGESSWVYNWDKQEWTTELDYPADYVRACPNLWFWPVMDLSH